jgi:hypothetical protein
MKKCTKCQQLLPPSSFSSYQSASRGIRTRSACRPCELQRGREYNNSHRESKRAGYRRIRAKKYLAGGDILLRYIFTNRMSDLRRSTRILNLPPISINADYLLNIFHQQKGLCFYTGRPMLYGYRKGKQLPNSLSVDRVDPQKGYVIGNIVLCINDANTSKGARNLLEFIDYVTILYNNIPNWLNGVASNNTST